MQMARIIYSVPYIQIVLNLWTRPFSFLHIDRWTFLSFLAAPKIVIYISRNLSHSLRRIYDKLVRYPCNTLPMQDIVVRSTTSRTYFLVASQAPKARPFKIPWPRSRSLFLLPYFITWSYHWQRYLILYYKLHFSNTITGIDTIYYCTSSNSIHVLGCYLFILFAAAQNSVYRMVFISPPYAASCSHHCRHCPYLMINISFERPFSHLLWTNASQKPF